MLKVLGSAVLLMASLVLVLYAFGTGLEVLDTAVSRILIQKR